MNDMESRKFEDAFHDAFKEAEVSPTENVWTNIELDLEKAEGDKMKRRIFFYKLLAAASIAFAMSVAGVGYYILKDQQRFGESLAVDQSQTKSSAERNTQTRTEETTGKAQITDGNSSDKANADQAIASNNSSIDGTENSATENSQAATSSSALPKDNEANEDNATGKSIASLNASDANASSNAKKNNVNGQVTATKKDDQASSATRQAKTNAVSLSESNTEKVYNASDKANQNSTAKTEQKRADSNKQNYTTDAPSTEGKQSKAQQNGQAIASTDQSIDKNTKGVNDIANTSSQQQQVTGSNVDKNGNVLNQRDQNSGVAEKQNTVASVEQKANDKTIHSDENASQSTNTQGIAANEGVAAHDNRNSSNRASASANDQKQTVASSADNKNTIDINPFSRYYNANGEFGQVNNTSTLAANTSVKKLPSRMDKPADFDATKLAPQEDPLLTMLAKLDAQEKSMSEEQKKEADNNTEKLWTSVGFAAGSFNTVNSNVSTSQSFAVNNVASQQAKASGSSYTVGLSMGTRLSKRWIVQGGVNYMTQSSDYTSNAVGASSDFASFSAPSVNSMMSEADNRILSTAPYTINSSLQFVSIPLQAGYMIVNKRFGVQLNGGVSTDMFLQNTLTPESDNVSKTTQGSGSESPYRTFNFSGLVGTEFSYKFGQHYRLALNPGIRYPFSSIYKSDQPITAMPLTFDVGLRFRYIFH